MNSTLTDFTQGVIDGDPELMDARIKKFMVGDGDVIPEMTVAKDCPVAAELNIMVDICMAKNIEMLICLVEKMRSHRVAEHPWISNMKFRHILVAVINANIDVDILRQLLDKMGDKRLLNNALHYHPNIGRNAIDFSGCNNHNLEKRGIIYLLEYYRPIDYSLNKLFRCATYICIQEQEFNLIHDIVAIPDINRTDGKILSTAIQMRHIPLIKIILDHEFLPTVDVIIDLTADLKYCDQFNYDVIQLVSNYCDFAAMTNKIEQNDIGYKILTLLESMDCDIKHIITAQMN